MTFIETDIQGVFIIEPKVFYDVRGYFFESFSKREFDRAIGRSIDFVQDNESRSTRGVVRGLHFQKGRHSQAKLVKCTKGRVLDVALDLRPGSVSYGRYVAVELSAENHRSFYIPRGFAHGFAVLSEVAEFQYKCDNYYCPEAEGGISILDQSLGIDWGVELENAILSDRDRSLPLLKDIEAPWTTEEIS